MRVSGAWRLLRARSRRRARSWTRAWRSSLQIRVITSTLAIGLVALTLVGAYVSARMADGLFDDRLKQVLQESARSTLQAQTTFDSSTATTGPDVQRLKGDVAVAQRTGGSDRREVFLLRAPGQQGGDMFIPGAASDQALVPLVSRELRLATGGRRAALAVRGDPAGDRRVSPGVMVGQDVTVPVDGTYQLFFLYSMQSEQDRLDFLQRTLGLAAVALVVLLGSMTWLVTRQTVRPCVARRRSPSGWRTVTCPSGCPRRARTRWPRWPARSTRWPTASRTRSTAWRSCRRCSAGSSRTCRTSCGPR